MADETQSAYIHFEPKGKIKGETADKTMAKYDACDIMSFELKGQNVSNIGSAQEEGGKVKFENFTVKKRTDKATTDLFREMCAASKLKNAIVTLMRNDRPYMQLTFKRVVIAEVSISQEGDDEAMDDITIDYGAVKIEYLEQDDKGETFKANETLWSRVKDEASDRV